jgi:hypothetical protein
MLLICVGLFATTNLILDQGRRDNGVTEPISDVAVGNPFIDSFIRAYLVGLGDYSTESFSAQNTPLVWILFILATLVT